MKNMMIAFALMVSTNVNASAFDVTGSNPDLYDGVASSTSLPTAIQPGIGDSYGSSILYSGQGYAKTTDEIQRGLDEGYGSILLDVGVPLYW